MKLAYHTIAWRGRMAEALRALERLGFQWFESGNIQPWLMQHDRLDELIDETGVRPIALYVGGSHIFPEDHPLELEIAERACSYLQAHEAGFLIAGGGYVRRAGASEEDYSILASFLEDLALLAMEYELQMCYHPHAGTMVETPGQIERIMRQTDEDAVGLCLDTAHVAQGGGDPLAICKTYRDRLAYVHLKDLDERGKFAELGKGALPIVEIVDYLRESSFEGPTVIELDAASDPSESARRNRDFALQELGLEL